MYAAWLHLCGIQDGLNQSMMIDVRTQDIPWGTGSPEKKHEGLFEVMEIIFILTGLVVTWMHVFISVHQTVCTRYMHFIYANYISITASKLAKAEVRKLYCAKYNLINRRKKMKKKKKKQQ